MFELVRVEVRKEGAFGVLKHDGVPFAVTLERTYDPDNAVKIPPGTYTCNRTRFNRGGYDTYQIPVPGHDLIKLHIGNTEMDSDGCVLVAKGWGTFGGQPGIGSSRLGFEEFMALADGAEEIVLVVR